MTSKKTSRKNNQQKIQQVQQNKDKNCEKIKEEIKNKLQNQIRKVSKSIRKTSTKNKYYVRNFTQNFSDDQNFYFLIQQLIQESEHKIALQDKQQIENAVDKKQEENIFINKINKKIKSQQIKNDQISIEISQLRNSVFVEKLFHHKSKQDQITKELQQKLDQTLNKEKISQEQKKEEYLNKLEQSKQKRKQRKKVQEKLMRQTQKEFLEVQQRERLYKKFEEEKINLNQKKHKSHDLSKYKKIPHFKKNSELKDITNYNKVEISQNLIQSNIIKKKQFSQKVKQEYQPSLDIRQQRQLSRLRKKQLQIKNLKEERSRKIQDNLIEQKQFLHQGYEYYLQNKLKLIEKAKSQKQKQKKPKFVKIDYLRKQDFKMPLKKPQLQTIQRTNSNLENMIDKINYSDKKSKGILRDIQNFNRKPNEEEQEILKSLYKENIERKINFIKKAFNNQIINMNNAPKQKFFQINQLQFYKKKQNLFVYVFMTSQIFVFVIYFINTFKLQGNYYQNLKNQNFLMCIVILVFYFNLAYYIFLAHINPGYYTGQKLTTINLQQKLQAKFQNQIQESAIEENFCCECSISQYFRTKHCRSCNLCVLTFDHHCFWLNNCVGEKNRMFYILYLFSIVLQNCYFIFLIFMQKNNKNFIDYFLLIFLILITSNLFYLLVLHLYLLSKNLTTWEHFSWHKITYLQSFDKKQGSPFNIGVVENMKLFIKNDPESRINWSFQTDLESTQN